MRELLEAPPANYFERGRHSSLDQRLAGGSMQRTHSLILTVIVVAVLVAARVAVADQSPAPGPSPFLVDISNNAFSPSALTVPAGSTVTWKNDDPYAHTVTMQGTNGFDSGNLGSGKSFSETFTAPGTYAYYCSIHPSMTGTITVTKGST
jgi:plastocyanin